MRSDRKGKKIVPALWKIPRSGDHFALFGGRLGDGPRLKNIGETAIVIHADQIGVDTDVRVA